MNPWEEYAQEEDGPWAEFSTEAPVESSAKGDLGESFKRASGDFVQAMDMILSIPGFALKVGERGMTSLIATLKNDPTPLATANKISDEVSSQGWRKFSLTPIETTLGKMGVEGLTEGTVFKEGMEEVGAGIQKGSEFVGEKLGSSELGEATKQLVDVGMLGAGGAAFRAAKPKESAVPKESIDDLLKDVKKEEPLFGQEPADLFPETLETPYGTRTGESPTGWSVDENGIPVSRAKTDELQRTEMAPTETGMEAGLGQAAPLGVWEKPREQGEYHPAQDFQLEPRPEEIPQQRGLDFEKVTPEELRTQTGDLFTPEMQSVEPRTFATPEQGIAHVQRIPTDVTPVRGEPFQPDLPGTNAPLGGVGKKGFGQGGAVDFTFGDRQKIKELTPTHKALQAKIKEGVQETLKRVEEYPDWKFQEGDKVRSKKTGKVYEIVARNWDKKNDRPMYNYKSAEGEAGQFSALPAKSKFSDEIFPGAHDSFELLSGPKKLGQGGFGKGQRGSIGWKAEPKSLEERAKGMSKDAWIKEFNQKYPGKEDFADQMYTRFSASAKVGGGSPRLESVVNTLDKALAPISTRVGNIHPELKQRLIDFEFRNTKTTGNRLDRVDSFLDDINRSFPLKEDRAAIDSLLLRNDYNTLLKVSPPELKARIKELKTVLAETGDELQKYGIVEGLREDYFPRMVQDLPGLYKEMGIDKATELQKLISERERKGGPLSDVELADITNKYLQGNYRPNGKAGFARGRKLENIPPEYEKYYASPTTALHSYLRSATFQIERAKFFGKNAAKDPTTGRINVEESIGNYLNDMLAQKKIKPEKAEEFAGLIRARFGTGQRASSDFVQSYKDLTHLALLGDLGNAAMQAADAFVVAAVDGIRPTIVGLAHTLKKDGITAKEFGLMNRLSDEFVSDRWTTKAVNKTFKWSGLAKVDELTKDLILNATMERGRMDVKNPQKKSTLYTEYKQRFGDEFPQLIDDLENGRRTELTDRYVISELANRQPIFKSEYSQAYLESPNAVRAAMTLTSFMLKMADFQRTRAYNQIKQGNTAKGLADLGKISLGLALGGVAMDTVRDFIANRPIDDVDAKKIAEAYFSTFRMGPYFSEDIKEGSFGDAAAGLLSPPFKAYFNDLGRDLVQSFDEDKEFSGKSLKYIPLIGDEIYGWSEYGQADREKKEDKMFSEELE